MPAKDEFVHHCAELFAPLGPVRVARMFGGHGIYVDGLFIAIVAADTLYLKADDQTAPSFDKAGGARFEYEAQGRKRVSLHYWTPPAEAMESPQLMAPWARMAIDAAVRARAKSPPRGKKR